jgi:hypothetical protein
MTATMTSKMADRFLYGDVATMEALEEGYQLRKNV